MMKKIFLFALCCITTSIAFSQPDSSPSPSSNRFKRKNSVQLELGGHGLAYSLNYERNLLNARFFKTSVQLGFSFYPKPIDLRSRLWIPLSINQLFSLKQHHLEAGLGLVFTQFQNYSIEGSMIAENKLETFISGKIGYRYQKPEGRMQYKILFTPLLEKEYSGYEFHPLAAVSIGYTF